MSKISIVVRTLSALAAVVTVICLTGAARTATITYVGYQNNVEEIADTPTTGWRNATPAKPLDIDGDNILGTDGWYIPGAVSSNADIQLPAYMASITKLGPGENWGYGWMDDPANPSGADTWKFGGWRWTTAGEHELTTITMSANAATLLAGKTLRIAWFYDCYNFTGSMYMRVDASSGGDSGSTPLLSYAYDGLDAAFFDINNVSDGDVIHLYGTMNQQAAECGGLAFDAGFITTDGDTNDDGVVDAADYIALKTHIGTATGATLADGDLDDDGDVDWTDLQTMMTALNSAGGQSLATPEPATLGLLALGALAVLRRRRA